MTDFTKIFDDKVALSNDYAYAGTEHGDAWLRKTMGYFITKFQPIKDILDMIAKEEHELKTEVIIKHVWDIIKEKCFKARCGRWLTKGS